MSPPHVHILGICGTFMGGIAQIASQAGYQVSGSDKALYPPMSDQLKSLGISTQAHFNKLTPADLYIVGNIMSRGNPIIEDLLEKKKVYSSGPAWLYENILKHRRVIAIAGTHGKTITTAMLTWILEYCGYQPSFLIGGVAENFGCSARLTNSDWFVIEADEYDTAFFDKRPKFLHYHPEILVINNLELDHVDIYDNLAQVEQQFHYLIRLLKPSATVIYRGTNKAVKRFIQKGCWSKKCNLDQQFRAKLLNNSKQNVLRVDFMQESTQQEWHLLGEYNIENAIFAIAAAQTVGIDIHKSLEALSNFKNGKRRQELKKEWQLTQGNIRLIDDFAHHPTAIGLTIEGIKQQFPQNRLVVLFDPSSNTMKQGTLAGSLPLSFSQADKVLACQTEKLHWQLKETLQSIGPKLQVYQNTGDLLSNLVSSIIQPNDIILMLSNGSFNNLPARLVEAMDNKFRDNS